jgi:hypothetical protein
MSSAFSIAEIASVLGIAASVNSLTGGGVTNTLGITDSSSQVGGGTGAGVAAAADPFAQYRSGLGALYAGSLVQGNQMDPTKMPGYSQYKSGVMDPALETSKRSAAASGQLYSGGESIALEKTAGQGYYGFMTDYMNRLAQGSGATQSPATAVGMGVGQGNLNNAAVMQGLGGITQGLSSYSNITQQANTNYGATGLPQSSFSGSGNASWADPSTNWWMTSS